MASLLPVSAALIVCARYKHEGDYAINVTALSARATKLRHWVRARPEKEIALVSHGFFNHYMTGDVNARGEQTTGWWGETELRTFEFVEGDERARIVETKESRERRGAAEES